MHSPTRIGLAVLMLLIGCIASFFGWQDYQLRQNQFYRLGMLYKLKFLDVGKDAIEEMKGDLPTGIFAMGMIPKNKIEKSDGAFIRVTLENFISSGSIDELHENADLFIKGYESTPNIDR